MNVALSICGLHFLPALYTIVKVLEVSMGFGNLNPLTCLIHVHLYQDAGQTAHCSHQGGTQGRLHTVTVPYIVEGRRK